MGKTVLSLLKCCQERYAPKVFRAASCLIYENQVFGHLIVFLVGWVCESFVGRNVPIRYFPAEVLESEVVYHRLLDYFDCLSRVTDSARWIVLDIRVKIPRYH